MSGERKAFNDFEPPVPLEEALKQAREARDCALTPALRATGLHATTVSEQIEMIEKYCQNHVDMMPKN